MNMERCKSGHLYNPKNIINVLIVMRMYLEKTRNPVLRERDQQLYQIQMTMVSKL